MFSMDKLRCETHPFRQTHYYRLTEGNYLIRWANEQGQAMFATRRLPVEVEHSLPEMHLSMFLPIPCDFYRDLKLQDISPEWKQAIYNPFIKLPAICLAALLRQLQLNRLRTLINSTRNYFNPSCITKKIG